MDNSGPRKIGDVEFTEQQVEEFKEAFSEFDIDGDVMSNPTMGETIVSILFHNVANYL